MLVFFDFRLNSFYRMLVGSLSNGNVHSCDLSTGGCTEINFDNGNSKGLTSLTLSEGGEVTVCFLLLKLVSKILVN